MLDERNFQSCNMVQISSHLSEFEDDPMPMEASFLFGWSMQAKRAMSTIIMSKQDTEELESDQRGHCSRCSVIRELLHKVRVEMARKLHTVV